jgi:hypothetical protein
MDFPQPKDLDQLRGSQPSAFCVPHRPAEGATHHHLPNVDGCIMDLKNNSETVRFMSGLNFSFAESPGANHVNVVGRGVWLGQFIVFDFP